MSKGDIEGRSKLEGEEENCLSIHWGMTLEVVHLKEKKSISQKKCIWKGRGLKKSKQTLMCVTFSTILELISSKVYLFLVVIYYHHIYLLK